MNIRYDSENDYVEIFIEWSDPTYGEEMGDDITLFKKEDTDEVVGVGILNFKKRKKSLKELLQRFNIPIPLDVSMSED